MPLLKTQMFHPLKRPALIQNPEGKLFAENGGAHADPDVNLAVLVLHGEGAILGKPTFRDIKLR